MAHRDNGMGCMAGARSSDAGSSVHEPLSEGSSRGWWRRMRCRQVYTGLVIAVAGILRLFIPNEEPGEGGSLVKCDADVLQGKCG